MNGNPLLAKNRLQRRRFLSGLGALGADGAILAACGGNSGMPCADAFTPRS